MLFFSLAENNHFLAASAAWLMDFPSAFLFFSLSRMDVDFVVQDTHALSQDYTYTYMPPRSSEQVP